MDSVLALDAEVDVSQIVPERSRQGVLLSSINQDPSNDVHIEHLGGGLHGSFADFIQVFPPRFDRPPCIVETAKMAVNRNAHDADARFLEAGVERQAGESLFRVTKEWDGNNFPDLASRARRGSPDPAVYLTEGLRPHVRLGDLRSARWQGRETLPQRAHRRWESREVISVPFVMSSDRTRGDLIDALDLGMPHVCERG